MNELEVYLYNRLKDNNNQLENELIDCLIKHNYSQVLNNGLVRRILSLINIPLNDTNLSSIESNLNLKKEEILKIMFYTGIASQQLYVWDNFLSFIRNDNNFDNCIQFMNQLFDKNNYDINIDGEQHYSIARSISLLKWSRFAITSTQSYLTEDHLVYTLWQMRSAIIHQISLTVPSNTLYDEIISYAVKIEESIENNKCETFDSNLKIELYNEILSDLLWFGDIERVKTSLESAQRLSGLTITLSGALGVRTQFQQKPVSQLVVKIDRIASNHQKVLQFNHSEAENQISADLPKNVALNDDTLLQRIKFISNDGPNDGPNEAFDLSKAEQSLMLSFVKSAHRIGSSSDELLREEILSYLDFLIENCKVWSILYHSLFIRSLLEKDSRRRVERSMSQINELVDLVRDSKHDFSHITRRYDSFYSVLPNPFWITEKYLAYILTSLGVTKSALEIYLRLHLWDDVIDCYQRLGRRDKAEAIIRDKLKVKETPYLYCLLGDTTDDIEYYIKSWTLSNEKYPRAQKSLGNHYFNLKQYVDCIPYFQRSVELNAMQIDVWFRLAFAAMTTEDYELAASAYRRVVQFETCSFEAWNNLSKAYIKLGQKARAWKTLQEALKCNYDEWRIWENYIAVCVDIGAFAEAIYSWHRLIDIKGKYSDDQIAEILVNCICNETLDNNHESAAKLAPKAQELFGRISATSSGTYKIWRLYARLLLNNKVNDIEKVIQCLQKCHRSAIQCNQWHKTPETIVEVLKHCSLLADEYCECALLDPTNNVRILSSCKMSLNSVLVLLEKNKLIWTESHLKEEIEKLIKECDNKLDFILNQLKTCN